jgi:predicted DCC family thiol-disulfide oxidoreductase YuxK
MNALRGWIFYDGACRLCRGSVEPWRGVFSRRGFDFVTLQDDVAQKRLNLAPGEIPGEMKVVTTEGEILGGIRAILYLGSQVGWLKPVVFLAGPFQALLDKGYRWIAANRRCLNGACSSHPPMTLFRALRHPLQQMVELNEHPIIPYTVWLALVAIAVVNSFLFGGILGVVVGNARVGIFGGMWVTLSAGMSWALLIPALWKISGKPLLLILHASLVTMAYGEIVLLAGEIVSLLFHAFAGPELRAPAQLIPWASAVLLSNVLMGTALVEQLRAINVRPLRTLLTFLVVLNGAGAVFFFCFGYLLLHVMAYSGWMR